MVLRLFLKLFGFFPCRLYQSARVWVLSTMTSFLYRCIFYRLSIFEWDTQWFTRGGAQWSARPRWLCSHFCWTISLFFSCVETVVYHFNFKFKFSCGDTWCIFLKNSDSCFVACLSICLKYEFNCAFFLSCSRSCDTDFFFQDPS